MTLTDLVAQLPAWLVAITTLVTAATALTALTPTKVDDNLLAGTGKVLNILLKVVNVLAGNVLKNTNAK